MSSLREKLEKVFAFFRPENLARQIIKYEGGVALLAIDVQKEFCDPKGGRGNAETAEISKRIQSLVPEFRKAGIPVYVVYFGSKKKNAADIDFYEFAPQADDVLVAKNDDSAFQGSNIKELLQKNKKKLLLTCGFNLSACVMSTVMDAITEGFEVCLLRDLTGNDNSPGNQKNIRRHLKHMRNKGVTIEQSGKVLELLCAKKNAPTVPLNELKA